MVTNFNGSRYWLCLSIYLTIIQIKDPLFFLYWHPTLFVYYKRNELEVFSLIKLD